MAKVGAQRAAELTGISKSTIQRAMKSGKISYTVADNGYREIDVSELERVYGLQNTTTATTTGAAAAGEQGASGAPQNSVKQELEKANTMIEMERLKMRIYMLEQQLESAHANIDELKEQRDQWQKQASQVLITSQYSQKQAEELKEQIRQRDERVRLAKARREQHMRAQMGAKQAAPAASVASSSPSAPSTPSMPSTPVVKQAAAQPRTGSFIDNSRSYTDLTQDARIAEAVKRESLLGGLLGRFTGKKDTDSSAQKVA